MGMSRMAESLWSGLICTEPTMEVLGLYRVWGWDFVMCCLDAKTLCVLEASVVIEKV